MPRPPQRLVIFIFSQFLFFSLIFNSSQASETSRLMKLGNKALDTGEYKVAEGFFEKILEVQPGNYLVSRELAEVKIKLNKLNEALSLLNDLLKLPVAKGRDILVYMGGEPNPLSAELVDETVMVIDKFAQQENDEFSKFVKGDPAEPVPHYRVYFKKTGKMKLLSKSKNRIKYLGIPAATREKIMVLKSQVKKKLISSINFEPKEEMVSIKAGCFQMGSKVGDPDELPVHEVCLSSFKLSKYEVNQKNYQGCYETQPF